MGICGCLSGFEGAIMWFLGVIEVILRGYLGGFLGLFRWGFRAI